jgi:hypothetical protein
MKTLLNAALLLMLASAMARAQINAGDLKPEPSLPFTMTEVATFKLPWRPDRADFFGDEHASIGQEGYVCRCSGARCPRAGADSSAPRSPFRPTVSTCF